MDNRLSADFSIPGLVPGTTTVNITYNFIITDSSIFNYIAPKESGGVKMKTFVVVKPGEDGYFVAECPSMPGCISQGRTKEEAVANIKEAIQLYLEVITEDDALDKPYEVYEVEV